MEITHRFVDLAARHVTADILPRDTKGDWYVPASSVLIDKVKWQLVKTGVGVEIPLVNYYVQPDMPHAFAFAVQLGAIVCAYFTNNNIVIAQLQCSIGVPVDEVATPQGVRWKIACGIGVRIQPK